MFGIFVTINGQKYNSKIINIEQYISSDMVIYRDKNMSIGH